MKLSVIIPTLNEAKNIERLVNRLKNCGSSDFSEIIVVDAGSTDDTADLAQKAGVKVLSSPKKGRAPQMNFGAKHATGNVLYFVHGDSLPPVDFYKDINQTWDTGSRIGGFRFKFESDKKILAFNNWTTQFDRIFVRGGDQTMFICRKLFNELDGFNEEFKIMEEYDFIERAQKKTDYKVIQNDVLVSARKYDDNSWARVQIANVIMFAMYRLKVSQDFMVKSYKTMLNYR